MNANTFLSFILVLTLFWMQLYARSREVYNGNAEYRAAVERLREEKQNDEIARDLEREEFLEFRQSVATLMPDVLKQKGLGQEGYAYRNLASVLTKSSSDSVRKLIAKTLFERGKEQFRNKEYEKSSRAFKQIIDRFSYTTYVTEAYFLLAEGYFQQRQLEEATSYIQHMVELFPNHELTGFALVRLGRIYELQHRNDDAVDIYKTVLRSFPQRDVASQARSSLRGVEL